MFDQKKYLPLIEDLYGAGRQEIARQLKRYADLDRIFTDSFGHTESHFFSTPGRTEISGNHTDHNNGRVIAASVNLDSIAVAASNGRNQVKIYSEGYAKPFIIDLDDLRYRDKEQGSTESLIRGIAAMFIEQRYYIGGFDACMTSDVLPGSGLSSSASIEVLIGTIFNTIFNNDRIDPIKIARIGQYAENKYFGKPCGLMDQLACAVGGIITIDFKNPEQPRLKKVSFDFNRLNYRLVVVNTGGNHVDLTNDYAAVPDEMRAVAGLLGKNQLRDISITDFLMSLPFLRKKAGDRAVLRAFHFFQENDRVTNQVKALQAGDFQKFLESVNDSGNSSHKWLQNIYSTQDTRDQGVALALALTENYIKSTGAGACRIHGGGFAGTILAILPDAAIKKYRAVMESVFGRNCVLVLGIRQSGTIHLSLTH